MATKASISATASLLTDPATKDEFIKQIKTSRARQAAFDELSPRLREAIAGHHERLDCAHIAKLLRAGWKEDQILAAINCRN